ncbi:MAG: fimbria/pilus periplasmic chaperone [Sphingomonadales bacterium]|jgi:fimbrial chaperone protein|nr:fimbria/pilus periplasmic chaperone [Sphingomonadales bacterium]
MMISRGTFLAAAAAAMSIVGMPAQAHRVYPMSYELAPAGSGAATVLRVDNTTERPLTLEVTVEKRSWDERGNETRIPADDDFLILPPQMIVEPGKTQAIRVQYVGAPTLDQTAMYVVGVNQVPVADPTAGTGVQFVINFGTAAYVVPAGAKTELKIASVTAAAEPGKMEVVLENTGARYAPLGNTTWTFTNGAGQKMELSGDPLRETLVASVVPSGGRRIFIVPASEGFALTAPIQLAIK